MRSTDDILEALGVTPNELGPVEKVSLPDVPVALGAAAAAMTANAVLEAADLRPVALPETARRRGISMYHSAFDPRVVLVEMPELPIRRVGTVIGREDNVIAVDFRKHPAGLAFNGGVDKLVVLFNPDGSIDVCPWKKRLLEEHIEHWRPPAPVAIRAPPMTEILGTSPCQPWLFAEAKLLARSPASLSRAAAAGLAARLWIPAKQARAAENERLTVGEGPGTRAIQWFRSVAEEERRAVESAALSEAEALADTLPSLQTEVARDAVSARLLVHDWLVRRDDLESVAVLWGADRAASAVGQALVSLDALAATHHSMFSAFDFSDDERLADVSWQEPDSWWGVLAGP